MFTMITTDIYNFIFMTKKSRWNSANISLYYVMQLILLYDNLISLLSRGRSNIWRLEIFYHDGSRESELCSNSTKSRYHANSHHNTYKFHGRQPINAVQIIAFFETLLKSLKCVDVVNNKSMLIERRN